MLKLAWYIFCFDNIFRFSFTNNRHFLFVFTSGILQVPVIQLKNCVMKAVIVHLMGNINFAIILVIHTVGVKGAVISKIIAGNRNFFANGQKYHAMTLVNVSSYIDDTLHFINVLLHCRSFHGYFLLIFTY